MHLAMISTEYVKLTLVVLSHVFVMHLAMTSTEYVRLLNVRYRGGSVGVTVCGQRGGACGYE